MNNKTQPGLVSIIVPAYRHEKYIVDLLNSIIQQDYDKIEVIICDDCSNDRTFQVALDYEPKIKERGYAVQICRNESNQGVCKTFNYLLSMCHGEYIKPIASDDFLAKKTTITEYVMLFAEKRNLDAIVSNAFMVDENARYPLKNELTFNIFYNQTPDYKSDGLVERLYEDNYICAPALIYRRKVMETVGKYDETIGFEDWDFNLRMAEENVEIEYLNECLVAYRQVGTSQVHNLTEQGCLRHCRGQIQTLCKHEKAVGRSLAVKMERQVLYRYYDIATSNNYAELHKYVRSVMKKKRITLINWYITQMKMYIKRCVRGRDNGK